MAKTDAEVKKALYKALGAIMDAGWIMQYSERPEVVAKGVEMIEEAKAGDVWFEGVVNQ